ncbi:transposase [Spiroplasma endosymbiont of Virgichneumon dumeticola]|uniref:transposase n=1 Tax=Spiroplasma endosymbiont of Virgichneumon dumeticola TaxID=3139323 RepID=UPI0035C8AA7C
MQKNYPNNINKEKFEEIKPILENGRKNKIKFIRTDFKKMIEKARLNNGRKEKTSFCIIDSQSVKNIDTAEEKCYGADKKIKGIKCHITVDTQGLPHTIYVQHQI